MTVSDDRLAAVAERAARAGGTYLAGAFRGERVDTEYGTDDVRSAADREAERRVLAVIREAFPEHAIHAEESGRSDGAEEADSPSSYRWFVDPLDGTNNFASGIPTFATAVAVARDGRTRAAAIHEPVPGDLYLARRGGGATVDGERLTADSDLDLARGTVALAVGLPALRDPALRAEADRMEDALEGTCRRVLRTWAPCVDWGLLARGGIQGMVAYHPAPYERHAGELLAVESGVASAADPRDSSVDADAADRLDTENPLYVGACNERLLSELTSIVA
ncbi:MAG: inositol monophosphatase family protein [Haloferacaceae archaeon]